MVNYQEGKIYRIVCNTTGLQYIGSTCDRLSNRFAGHKSTFKVFLNGGGNYTSSYEILKNNNCEIILIENYPCADRNELLARERYWIENTPNVNKIRRPSATKEELMAQKIEYNRVYREEHKEERREKAKIYYEKIAEELVVKRKETFDCVCGAVVTKLHKKRHEESAKHIEYLKKQGVEVVDPDTVYTCECGSVVTKINRDPHERSQKHYAYLESKGETIDPELKSKVEELKEKKHEKYVCECGLEVSKSHKARHEKTKRHIDALA